MKLVFIINGVDIEVELPKWSTLETAREIALSEAEIVGRPPEDPGAGRLWGHPAP